MALNKLAGLKAPTEILENVADLVSSYYTKKPDVSDVAQKVTFGTSGHRGNAYKSSFNEEHILAITQAVAEYRKTKVSNNLFIGMDTHALSTPAHKTALEVLAANGVTTYYSFDYTPTPAISHAILTHVGTDGIVVTPSHNPPSDGGFKYNSTDGGPANEEATGWIENRANEILANGLKDVKRMPLDVALASEYLVEYDYTTPYVEDLVNVIDMELIQKSGLHIGADAMGGSGFAFYRAIKEKYHLNMDIFNDRADFTFSFMHCDKDGKIRMDCSSPYAMAGLVDRKDDFDISFGNDTDFDRHGIVTKSKGLMNPNHYLAVAIDYLAKHRNFKGLSIGKTLVSSSMIDRVCKDNGIEVLETPVGFKWFVNPMSDGQIFFGGEESAGASFLRKDKGLWSTDKDGIIMTLLSVEILARTGMDAGDYYEELTNRHGNPVYARLDAVATYEQKEILKNLSPDDITSTTLAGEKIERIITVADNGAKIGGLKVVSPNGWFALRPSGTEDVYKIYAESFLDETHLASIQNEAQEIVNRLFN